VFQSGQEGALIDERVVYLLADADPEGGFTQAASDTGSFLSAEEDVSAEEMALTFGT